MTDRWGDGPPGHDTAALLSVCVAAARAGGEVALAGRRRMRSGAAASTSTKSSTTDLVTEHDQAAERAVVEVIRAARPGDAIVGEEGTADAGTSGYEWFVDPIDGTTNFVYDLPSWCTSVAVGFGGTTLAGAVFAPVSGELFSASLGGGAHLDGRPLRCSDADDLQLALVATGFGYRPEVRTAQARRVAAMIGHVRDIRRLGSAAIDLCHVAAGRVDAYFEEHLNAWDAAAGELVAREAGCRSTDFTGGPPRPAELLVAAPGVHTALIELLAATR